VGRDCLSDGVDEDVEGDAVPPCFLHMVILPLPGFVVMYVPAPDSEYRALKLPSKALLAML